MSILKNRKIGLITALSLWAISCVISYHGIQESEETRRTTECASLLKSLCGATEMYHLDKNINPTESPLMRMDPARMQDHLIQEGYLSERMPCPGGALVELRLHSGQSSSEVEPFCPGHGRFLRQSIDASEARAMSETPFLWLLAHISFAVLSLALSIAALVRSKRWGDRYRTGRERLLPASWIIALNVLFAPAGLLAMGRHRQAVWQLTFILLTGFYFSLPWILIVLPATAWVAITRFHEEHRRRC